MRKTYAIIAIGAGILLYLYWHSRHKLIEEYINELKLYEKALMQAYADGEVDETEYQFLTEMQVILTKKEEAIRGSGLLGALIDALKAYGISIAAIVGGFYITTKVIRYLIKKYRPPKYKCEKCGRTFATEEELREHIQKEHKPTQDTSKYDEVIYALQETPDWFKDLLGLILGYDINFIYNIINAWDTLSPEEKVRYGLAIVIAIIVLIAFARWFAFIPGIRNVLQAALRCIT